MARVNYNAEEKAHDIHAIEEAIMGKLRAGETAEVMVEDLEKCCQVVTEHRGDSDEDEPGENAPLSEKCDAICSNLAKLLRSPVEYSNKGRVIEFRMVTARPK
jgi:hypothetical protein